MTTKIQLRITETQLRLRISGLLIRKGRSKVVGCGLRWGECKIKISNTFEGRSNDGLVRRKTI